MVKQNSLNCKEKVFSNAIVAAGNLFQTFTFSELGDDSWTLLESCLQGLLHKNAKVGWDAATALLQFYCNPTMPHAQVAELVIPQLINTLRTQLNFKTRISAAQLLRNYRTALLPFAEVLMGVFLSTLEQDKGLVIWEIGLLQYQKTFRTEMLDTLIHLVLMLQGLDEALIRCLEKNLVLIYDWLRKLALSAGAQRVKGASEKLLGWIEQYPAMQVSFGLKEQLRALVELDTEQGAEHDLI